VEKNEKNAELVDWVESNANEALKFSLSVTESLLKDAGSLLNILIAGVGGSMAFLIPQLQSGSIGWLAVAISASGIYLAIVGALLLHKVIRTGEFQTPGTLLSSLFQPEFSLVEMKIAENENIEIKRGKALKRNIIMAKSLDFCRCLTLATPLVFILSGLVFHHFSAPVAIFSR